MDMDGVEHTNDKRRSALITQKSSLDFQHDENEGTNEIEVMEVSDEENANDKNDSIIDSSKLKSNVWKYAKKLSPEKAQCLVCKKQFKTTHGATTTLRSHLINSHKINELLSRVSSKKKKNSVSYERKRRLDYLANLAIFEDGRSFGDLRKKGMQRFLSEIAPGEDDSDDESIESEDLLTDAWGDDVATPESDNVDEKDEYETNAGITKKKLAETIQKSRSLICMIRRSQALAKFVDQRRSSLKMSRRLSNDCITRWNSTFISLKSFLEHKTILLNLFENKSKLPLTSKQNEKLTALELSSDEWTIVLNLILLLEPFYHATDALSGSKYPTIGLTLFVLRSIKEFLETEDDTRSNVYITLKGFLLDSFDHYFNEDDDQHRHLLFYGYFDPVGYSTLTSNERVKIERRLKQKLKESNENSSSNIIIAMTTSSLLDRTTQSINEHSRTTTEKTNRLSKFLKSIDKSIETDKSKPKTISEEIAYYSSLCRQTSDLDVLSFWKLHGERIPILKAMARQYLTTPSTSVPSESAFSISAYIARKERARLSPENLAYTIFLKDKLQTYA